MKALVVYDTEFGNTERVAQAIGQALTPAAQVEVVRVGNAQPAQLAGVNLLLAGSPTRAFRPTPATTNWLKSLPAGSLRGVRMAGFDTRVPMDDPKIPGILRFMARLFGNGAYAAPSIAKGLARKGGEPAAPPEGFFVTTEETPQMVPGELERAAEWARRLVAPR